ncbi:dephospho-CoA kinase [Lichenicola cladoniae]|uniref:Dephospho-CoA kinase n=1 Tax=Lichenicola cladoniae TaxID=1484109 RepID=A0A6M8HRD7_9PROT|nr:dephospho-CoA kinase [Lichenicola cladoniae]NPD65975.1 dephospho-CoA kinase [Acetobacteraceae bacterium]QKE91039.1 dephospho-CoA kinase [Lichenicola cladoniae]
MKIIGLTGGIGMGKSTAAAAMRRAGLPVFDADAEVHALQAPGGQAVPAIARLIPDAVRDGRIDRAVLRRAVIADASLFTKLERIMHPLVRASQARFLGRARRAGRCWAVLDIPLLFERGGYRACDLVVVVSAPRALQLQRVRRRRGMSEAEALALIARQMPDAEKRRRADLVISTGLSRWHSLRQIRRMMTNLTDPETTTP